jgi:Protein of unknown function (DUF4232)
MRFKVVRDSPSRPAAGHRLAIGGARSRAATVGALAVAACGVAACGLAVTACGDQNRPQAAPSARTTGGAAAAPSSPSPGSIESCAASQLKVGISNSGALAGQAGGYLRFTNDSHTPCRMTGWPVATGLSATGTATLLRHAQSTMFGAWHYTAPPPVVTLQPGDSAYAVVVADDQPAGGQSRCPAPYVRLRVSPPGGSGSTVISAWLPGAGSYLPACTSVNGSTTAETSTIATLSSLPH